MKINNKTIKLIINKDIKTKEQIYNHYYKLVHFIIYKQVNNKNDIDDLT